MQSGFYKGYSIWGHAIPEGDRYAANGTITHESRVIEGSGVLGYFTAEEDAQVAGLAWARAWIDRHNGS
ncbi:hypothetical protein LMG29542_07744 [Paraburkholderia humisilvae]|uniref:Transposase n=1 Tax=Paraburkholderia humisilvae TaxID=627669 RepID=A0A6J5FAV7_9BURK|nr:hypothetical protein [Paraburkholderia humisilvae]CAB3774355.1 hypothetical protein LMG29542_07744 [Paraburkholderia humisilvae]